MGVVWLLEDRSSHWDDHGVVSKNTNGIESSTLEALSKSAETDRRRADSAKGERLEDPRYRAVLWCAPTPMRLRGGNS